MAEYHELYQRARHYDIVFRRDVAPEVDFIVELARLHLDRPPGSVLELACGPGYHAREFARRGIRAIGLDLEPEMVRFARDRAEEEGVQVGWVAGDMREFRLDEPIDVAISMFDGIDALTDDDDLIRHFRAVAENLNEGGLYIIDLTHPRVCGFQSYGRYRYTGTRDGVRVELRWPAHGPEIDWAEGTARVGVEIRVHEDGEGRVVHDTAEERFLSPQEIRLLARCSGALEPVGWHGDYDIGSPVDDPSAERLIAVLQARHD